MTKTVENEQEAIDFSKLDLVRGQTKDGIKDKCFRLCRQYLTGVWQDITVDEVEVRRIAGGLTNQLYYCGVVTERRITGNDVPQEVAIRLYEKKHFNNYDKETDKRLSDTIISLLVSVNGLGPKIYGLFEEGQIQGYYEHRQFKLAEQGNPKLVDELAKKLARIHAMDVPIKKSGNWLFESWNGLYREAKELFDLDDIYKKCDLKTFLEHDFEREMEWLKKTIIQADSPVTFNHVDFRSGNIMVTPTDQIVLCDFEYSSYGYRGADFGSIFAEWGQTTMWGNCVHFADDNTLLPFIEAYILESVKVMGKKFSDDPRNCSEHILNEGKVFSLASMMFMILILLKHNESIVEGMAFEKDKQMVFAEEFYANYQRLKQKFISDNVIKA